MPGDPSFELVEDVEFVGDVLTQVLAEMESTVRFLPCK